MWSVDEITAASYVRRPHLCLTFGRRLLLFSYTRKGLAGVSENVEGGILIQGYKMFRGKNPESGMLQNGFVPGR